MPDDMPEDRLDAALDRAAGRADERIQNGHTDTIARAAAALHAADARDASAEPRPGFLAALREELAVDRPSVHMIPSDKAGSAVRLPRPRFSQQPTGPRGLGMAGWIALAAVLALTVASAITGLRGRGGEPGGAQIAAVSIATPDADVMVPLDQPHVNISECDVAARPDGRVASLVDQAPSRPPLLPTYTTAKRHDGAEFTGVEQDRLLVDPVPLMRDLPVADSEERAGITATIRRLTACRHYFNPVQTWTVLATPTGIEPEAQFIGLDGRLFANFSDDFFRKEAFLWTGPGVQGPQLSVFWIPMGPIPWTLGDARRTADGRIVAIVDAPGGTPYFKQIVAVFSEHEGRWLIDEFGLTDLNIVRASAFPRYLEVVLQDLEGPSLAQTIPSAEGFQNDRPITVTVANIGAVAQRFMIDRLGINLEVPAGSSVSFVLNAPIGKYVMESYVPDASTGLFDPGYRRLEAILRIVGAGTPLALG